MATSIDVGVADGIIGKYKVGVFKNDYTGYFPTATPRILLCTVNLQELSP